MTWKLHSKEGYVKILIFIILLNIIHGLNYIILEGKELARLYGYTDQTPLRSKGLGVIIRYYYIRCSIPFLMILALIKDHIKDVKKHGLSRLQV